LCTIPLDKRNLEFNLLEIHYTLVYFRRSVQSTMFACSHSTKVSKTMQRSALLYANV
jgi:hypothetical protein